MTPTLCLLSLTLGAPALKELPDKDFQVVHATCVAVREVEGLLEATFVICVPGSEPDVFKGAKFVVRYVDVLQSLRAYLLRTLRLPKFQVGDSSYWVTCRTKDGQHLGIDNGDLLRKRVLPDPYHLIHLLSEKEIKQDPIVFPDHASTRELAGIVSRGLRLKTVAERDDFILQESDNKNVFVKQYLEWLGKKDAKK